MSNITYQLRLLKVHRHFTRRLAVMVGDSLKTDIKGALSAGLHAVLLNRLRSPVPVDLRAQVLDSFEPPERSIAAISGADGAERRA